MATPAGVVVPFKYVSHIDNRGSNAQAIPILTSPSISPNVSATFNAPRLAPSVVPASVQKESQRGGVVYHEAGSRGRPLHYLGSKVRWALQNPEVGRRVTLQDFEGGRRLAVYNYEAGGAVTLDRGRPLPITGVTGTTGRVVSRSVSPLYELSIRGRSIGGDYAGALTMMSLTEVSGRVKIGKGSTAVVYKGTWKGTEVALKMFKNKHDMNILRELQIVFRLRHPNLVLLMAAVPSDHGISAIVSEYCAGGSLFDLLHLRKKAITWQQIVKIATDIAKGCNYLHSLNPPIVHRDLKSMNILLASPVNDHHAVPMAKISDFGMSVLKTSSYSASNMLTGIAGTYYWMAPEVFVGHPYKESVDVYSYGIILWELATGLLPYESSMTKISPEEVGRRVAHLGMRPDLVKLPSNCPQSLIRLMQQCWQHDPTRRPTFSQIVQRLSQTGKT